MVTVVAFEEVLTMTGRETKQVIDPLVVLTEVK